jgi:hypothetical protein
MLRCGRGTRGCRYGRKRAADRPDSVLTDGRHAVAQSSKWAGIDWSNTNSGLGSAWVGSKAGL